MTSQHKGVGDPRLANLRETLERNVGSGHLLGFAVLLLWGVWVVDLAKSLHLSVVVLVRDGHDGQVDTSFLSSVLLQVIELLRSEGDTLRDARGFSVSRKHFAVVSHV